MANSFKSVIESCLYAYAEDITDDNEFMKRYDDSHQVKFIVTGILKISI